MHIIVACDSKNGIGLDGNLPWKLKKEMSYFTNITTSSNNLNVVIMGRNTWNSIPNKFRPLPNRINIVISSTLNECEENKDIIIEKSLNDALIKLELLPIKIGDIFVIGGERLYTEAINHEKINKLYITQVGGNYKCDRQFPTFSDQIDFNLISVSKFSCENDIYFRYLIYEKKNTNHVQKSLYCRGEGEQQYLDMLKNILDNGIKREDRTGVGTLSTFGNQFTYDISDTIPLLTTKRMYVRAIFEELALYISGKTDNSILQDKNIHIWDGNTTRDFLDKRGLTHYSENDMGETYGFNFRHYGAPYETCKNDYTDQGFDQLNYVIEQIKTNPTSRRIIINLWNAATMHKAALPACLCMYQFYVDTVNKKLNLQIYIRSSDFFLANNWNTCTGAFLVYMLCNLKDIDLSPGKLSVITGDTHIYLSHIDAVKTNLERNPRPFPKLLINSQKENIEDYCWEDFTLVGYNPLPNITAPMAV